jgi:undecaprenyl-diphosphatase
VLGELGNTLTIVALVVACAGILRWRLGRWHEAGFVVLAVAIQATVFMLTQLVIERQRPDVLRLDTSPPTSSFPSGHTGAARRAVRLARPADLWHVRRPAVRVGFAVLLVALPLLVAYARLYRGMHHPSDVTASFVNGSAAVWAGARATLAARWRGVGRGGAAGSTRPCDRQSAPHPAESLRCAG